MESIYPSSSAGSAGNGAVKRTDPHEKADPKCDICDGSKIFDPSFFLLLGNPCAIVMSETEEGVI